MYKSLYLTSFFKGRVLNIKLDFKKKRTLDLTLCYLPANSQATELKTDCTNFIQDIISKHTSSSYSIILGDFNTKPKDKSNFNYKSIMLLKSNNYTDLAKYHHENNTPDPTHNSNRIDFQFSNALILPNTIHTFTQTVPSVLFSTNH